MSKRLASRTPGSWPKLTGQLLQRSCARMEQNKGGRQFWPGPGVGSWRMLEACRIVLSGRNGPKMLYCWQNRKVWVGRQCGSAGEMGLKCCTVSKIGRFGLVVKVDLPVFKPERAERAWRKIIYDIYLYKYIYIYSSTN